MLDDRIINLGLRSLSRRIIENRSLTQECLHGHRMLISSFSGMAIFLASGTASAQTNEELVDQLNALKQSQAQLSARIQELETKISGGTGKASKSTIRVKAATTTSISALPSDEPVTSSPLAISGDLRLRYEANLNKSGQRNRHRGALRARVRASYEIADWLTIGGQVTTGDPDDPNSSDVTLSNFDDDLTVSLDRAYARFSSGGLEAVVGKFAHPFETTDLVWDGDVNPQGIALSHGLPLGNYAQIKSGLLYFIIDENPGGTDSDMIGGQLSLRLRPHSDWTINLSGAYYDYRLESLIGADVGDFRSNRMLNGNYLSDFNLVDALISAEWHGLGPRWPMKLSGNLVHNFGAPSDVNDGMALNFAIGRSSEPDDWRFGYGYAQAGVDAVLAAFSQDNITIATNYRQHMWTLDYALTPSIFLNSTWYHYQPKDIRFIGPGETMDWIDRIRFNLLINF